MAFLFGRGRQRSNSELCKQARLALQKLLDLKGSDARLPERAEQDLATMLAQMKITLQGTAEQEVDPQMVHQLVHLLLNEDLLLPLAKAIGPRLPFESRKDVQAIFATILRYNPSGTAAAQGSPETASLPPVVQYISTKRPEIMPTLCDGYENQQQGALACGGILREALKHEQMTLMILCDEPESEGGIKRGLDLHQARQPASGNGVFWKLFDWIVNSAFDVGADAFSTFKTTLTTHKALVAQWIDDNFDLFFDKYKTSLLDSKNYVVKRQSLGLLSTILLDRAHYKTMIRWIKSVDNLKISMNLLREEQRMIKYEAFHVFKIFVANPNKDEAVKRILVNNRERLLKFLPDFLSDRADDQQFEDEKAYITEVIYKLPTAKEYQPPQSASPSQTSGGAVTA